MSDPLEEEVRAMSDAELRERIEAIVRSPKRAGRRLNVSEAIALAALMAEEARRVRA